MQATEQNRFEAALRCFDEVNSNDPNLVEVDGLNLPRELVYSEWLTAWVLRLRPDASEELRLAARCQHICRWEVPRMSYPMTRPGYLQWREGLKKLHARKAAEILQQVGYAPNVLERVQNLVLKKNFPNDAEGRVLEDGLCLVFLERQLGELAAKTSDEKVVNALRKSWNKMTPRAQLEAKNLHYSPREKELLNQALAG